MSRLLPLLSALTLAGGLAACSDSGGPSGTGRQVTFQLATRAGAPTSGPALSIAAGTSETFALGTDTLVINQVQVVLRKIELERASATACDTLATSDDCAELEAGPILLDLPLGSGAARAFSIAVDTGTYTKLQFQVHRPESGSRDAAFLQINPDFQGTSIKVSGTFNGTPFIYRSDLDVGQEHSFNPPLSVTDAASAQLTLFVDLSTWFLNGAATGLVDPASALIGQSNEGLVKSNIEASFHAFEDDDRDGRDDHGVN